MAKPMLYPMGATVFTSPLVAISEAAPLIYAPPTMVADKKQQFSTYNDTLFRK